MSNLSCLKSPTWWFGTFASKRNPLSSSFWASGLTFFLFPLFRFLSVAVGEIANFAAYSFAPAILVTPIGGLSVVISAVLAWIFLKERLDNNGKIGCALCIIGSTIIVLHAPEEREITEVRQILDMMVRPAFLTYAIVTILGSILILWKVAPKYGKRNMLVYISVCSFAGSLTVVGVKGSAGASYFLVVFLLIPLHSLKKQKIDWELRSS